VVAFNEENHTYTLDDGTLVPSVTEIIHAVGLSKWRAGRHAKFYMERGKLLHTVAAWWDQGCLDEDSVDPAVAPHLRAYKEFVTMNRSRIEWLEIEEPLACESLRFAGTPDRVLLWDGKRAILDLKTGSPAPWHQVQTAGYAMLAGNVQERLALYVGADAKWKLDTHEEPDDRSVFGAALAVYWWKKRNGQLQTKGVGDGGGREDRRD
jgi:hypothetical protein